MTDVGLKELAGMTNLRELSLRSSAFTDEGLKHLVGLKSLGVLHLGPSKFSVSAQRELHDALPELQGP